MTVLVYILIAILLIALILAGLTFIVMMIDFIIRVTTEYHGIADAIHAKRENQRRNHEQRAHYDLGSCGDVRV